MDKNLVLKIQMLAADKLSGSLKKIVGLGEKGGQALSRMKREARDLDNQLKDVRARLSAGSMQGGLLMAERELVKAIEQTNRQIERRQQLMKIDNRVAKMQVQAESMKSAGTSNMIGGASMLAPLVMAGREAMLFSSGMVDIQQKAGLTNAEMVKMRGNILNAAQATHQLPEDMRSAVDVLAGKGMDPRNAVTLIDPIGRLGTAFKVDLADGAAAAYANINNLKLPLNQTAKAFDVMAAGGNAGAFEIKDMAKWFPNLTARMQALGQKGLPAVADLTAALQVAMNTAGSSDEAANNISNLMAKINSPETIRKFHKNFAVDLPAAMALAAKKGKTPLEAIAEITQKATGGDMKKLGFVFEDQQAQMGLLALIQNMDQYKQMRAEIAKASGVVDGAFAQREMNDGMVAWNSFKVSLSTTALVFGTKLLPIATQFLGILGPMIGAVGDFAQAHPQATTALLTMVAGIGAARVGLGALQFAFGSILGPAAKAWGAYQKFKTLGSVAAAFPKFAKAAGFVRTAVMLMAKGVMRAGLMMLANPVVLAIVAIVAVVGTAGYLIWKHWDTIKAAFHAGVEMLRGAGDWIKQKILQFPAMFGPLGFVAKWIITHWGQIKAAFWMGVEAIGQAWSWVKTKVGEGVSWLKALPGQMLTYGKAIIQGLANGILAAPGAVWNALKSVIWNGITNAKNLLQIKSPSRVFMQMGGHISEGLALGVERREQRPIRAVGKLATGVAGALAVASPSLAATGGATGAAIKGGASGAAAAPVNISITIQQQPGEDGEALAQRVAKLIEQKIRTERLRAYYD